MERRIDWMNFRTHCWPLAAAFTLASQVLWAAPASADPVDVVPIDWSLFNGPAPSDPASSRERDLLLKSNKYAVNYWWSYWGYAAQSGAYLDFGNAPGEDQIRMPGAQAFALAVSLKTNAYDAAVTGVSASLARDEAIRLLASVARAHRANLPSGSQLAWGAGWQTSLWASLAAFAGWLLWDDLSAQDRAFTRKMIEYECNWLKDRAVPYWKLKDGTEVSPGNTRAEENWWNGAALNLCTAMMPNHPSWSAWMDRALEYNISALARPSDTNSTTVVNGRTLSQWLKGYNFENDGTSENHGFLNVDYVIAVTAFGVHPFALRKSAAPAGLWQNNSFVYSALTDLPFPSPPWATPRVSNPTQTIYVGLPSALSFSDALYYPDGSDWGEMLYNYVLTDAQAKVFGWDNSPNEAATWEDRHSIAQAAMQNRYTDGSTFSGPCSSASSAENKYRGCEADASRIYAETYLTKWLAAQGAYSWTSQSYQPSIGTIPPGDWNEDDLNIRYSGTGWTRWNDPADHNGRIAFSNIAGNYYEFTYTGTRAKIHALAAYDGGIAKLYVDGIYKRDLDFYAPGVNHKHLMYDTATDSLAPGTHTIRLTAKGTKSASSSGFYVYSDEILVDGIMTAGTYDDAHPYIVYARPPVQDDQYTAWGQVSWNPQSGSLHYQNGMRWCTTTGYYFEFTYNGNRARVYGEKHTSGGYADVYVDGVFKRQIDYYNSSVTTQQLMYDSNSDSIASGTHTVRVVINGKHQSASQGASNLVSVDKVVID